MNFKKDKTKISKGQEAYLLKIYRRSSNPRESMVGTIEDIKGGVKIAFKTPQELLLHLEKQQTNDNQ